MVSKFGASFFPGTHFQVNRVKRRSVSAMNTGILKWNLSGYLGAQNGGPTKRRKRNDFCVSITT